MIFKTQLPGPSGKLLHTFERAVSAVKVSPHRPSRLSPCRLDAVGEVLRVRWWAEIGNNGAVDQRIQVAADHHDSPGGRNCPHDRRRLAQSLGFGPPIAQLIRIIQRLAVAKPYGEAAPAVGLQGHTAVIDQVGLSYRAVAGVVR